MSSIDYQKLALPYATPAECHRPDIAHRPVIVVGGGPVGLTTAVDLARYGTPVLLLDDDDKLSSGSRAICFAKRTLEIWDRLGCGEPIASKGVSWQVGKVFFRDELVYAFDLLPEAGHCRPAFVNLQQYYVEGLLYDHALAHPNLEMRWKHKVVGIEQSTECATVTVETPDGIYRMRCDYVVACDGSHSSGADAARTGNEGPDLSRPVPDRRREDGCGSPGRAALLVRSAVSSARLRADAPATGQRLADRLPARHRRRSARRTRTRSRHSAACARCSAATRNSSSSGAASIRSPACGWTTSVMDGSCSQATPRTACRRSARGARTAACRMPTISRGSCISCFDRMRRSVCSTRMRASASARPTRTSPIRPAARIS